jgi:hypothetical protein
MVAKLTSVAAQADSRSCPALLFARGMYGGTYLTGWLPAIVIASRPLVRARTERRMPAVHVHGYWISVP